MIKVRTQTDSDSDYVKSIISTTTDELRAIYRPVNSHAQSEIEESICVVAVINKNIVGAAKYLINKNNILIRNLAVSPDYRKQGVARAIIEHATLKGKSELVLSTIKETGNINIFLHLGFNVDKEFISENFEGIHGKQVTQVKMRKKIV